MFWLIGRPEDQTTAETLVSTLSRSWLVAALLASLLVGPSPQAWIALAPLVLQSFSLYWPLAPRVDIPLTLVSMLIAPLGLSPEIGAAASVAVVLPGLALLDLQLRDLSALLIPPPFQTGRRTTTILNSLAATALAVGLLGLLAGNLTTVLVAAILMGGLLVRLGDIIAATRAVPVTAEPVRLRVLAREEGRVALSLRSETAFSQRLALSSNESWLNLYPKQIDIGADAVEIVELAAKPPLAAPWQPAIHVMSVDQWGLFWTGTEIHPLTLHVIPRARYALWLARRYLEATGGQQAQPNVGRANRFRGVEYNSSRIYQPGDRLKDVDWRHTAKSPQTIVKEHSDPQGGPTVILVNLVAGDAEEADWLGFHVVSSALTAARQGIPSALVAYDAQDAVLVAGMSDPRNTLIQAMRITEKITLISGEERLLAPPDLPRLRRAVANWGADGSNGPHAALRTLLLSEIQTLEDLAQGHPLTAALQHVLKGGALPTVITVVSRWNHDSTVLAVALPRLRNHGYRIFDLRGGKR